MSRRIFVFFMILACTFGVLLMLSALMITPANTDASAETAPVAHTVTAFFSIMPTPPSENSTVSTEWLRISALFTIILLMLPIVQCVCDANGRVVHCKRYTRSFHLVFKPELACG